MVMGRALLEAVRPPMWEFESGREGAGCETVRLGKRHIRLSDIESVSLEEIRDRNHQGLLLGALVFVSVAAIFAYLVFDAGWCERFLLGMAFLACLGVMGLGEVAALKTVRLFEMIVTLRDGQRVVFTSADKADIEALELRLMASRARAA